MMEVLAQDRISELVEAAKASATPRRPARVRTVDFSRPTKFGVDHQRRLNQATETFCQAANTRLSGELRCPVELEALGTAQLTWSATQSQIAPRSLMAVIELQPIGTKILLTVEQSFVLVCLECMLGGAPERPARERRLSEIDRTLAKNLFGSIISLLSTTWTDLAGVTMHSDELDAHDISKVASVSEPTHSTQIEVRLNQQSYSIGLLVPWASIEPIERLISGHEEEVQAISQPGSPMNDRMAAVPVTVRAEAGHATMAVRDILALTPGSIISFGRAAADGVELYADSVPIALGRAGRTGPTRAVQLTGFFEDDPR
jgi:flagellar motor switch protein FliM